jgi:hypothetical protein
MARRDDRKGSLPSDLQELWSMVVAYAKQETIDPIKGLGRYVVWGLLGALALSLGLVLLMLGGLRLLQTETGSAFDGRLTWVPYVLVVVASGAAAALAISRTRGNKKEAR